MRATCPVCPHLCTLEEGELGFCRGRRCIDGVVVDENYGRITSLALDPIEKKPLAAFLPGTKVLSVGSYGCNLACGFCQNASISFATGHDVPWRVIEPASLVNHALELQNEGCVGIAYTYNEPLIGFEFVRDCGRLAHEAGLKNILVSNGMVNPAPLEEIAPLVDAANIDLKGFSQEFYDSIDGDYEAVRRTIERLVAAESCHLEVTTLVIPGINDDPAAIERAAQWLASLDATIVYHLTRFFPCHRFTSLDPTPIGTLASLAELARVHLADVRLGNC